jgi:hypothetical protein
MSPDEIEFTRLQIARLDQLDPTPESIAALERDFNRADKAQELAVLATQLESGLAGEEGAAAKFPMLVRAARELAALDPVAAGLAQRLEAAVVELQELGGDFGRLGAGLDFDEEATRILQERMSLWLELQRRYGGDAAALRAKRGARPPNCARPAPPRRNPSRKRPRAFCRRWASSKPASASPSLLRRSCASTATAGLKFSLRPTQARRRCR